MPGYGGRIGLTRDEESVPIHLLVQHTSGEAPTQQDDRHHTDAGDGERLPEGSHVVTATGLGRARAGGGVLRGCRRVPRARGLGVRRRGDHRRLGRRVVAVLGDVDGAATGVVAGLRADAVPVEAGPLGLDRDGLPRRDVDRAVGLQLVERAVEDGDRLLGVVREQGHPALDRDGRVRELLRGALVLGGTGDVLEDLEHGDATLVAGDQAVVTALAVRLAAGLEEEGARRDQLLAVLVDPDLAVVTLHGHGVTTVARVDAAQVGRVPEAVRRVELPQVLVLVGRALLDLDGLGVHLLAVDVQVDRVGARGRRVRTRLDDHAVDLEHLLGALGLHALGADRDALAVGGDEQLALGLGLLGALLRVVDRPGVTLAGEEVRDEVRLVRVVRPVELVRVDRVLALLGVGVRLAALVGRGQRVGPLRLDEHDAAALRVVLGPQVRGHEVPGDAVRVDGVAEVLSEDDRPGLVARFRPGARRLGVVGADRRRGRRLDTAVVEHRLALGVPVETRVVDGLALLDVREGRDDVRRVLGVAALVERVDRRGLRVPAVRGRVRRRGVAVRDLLGLALVDGRRGLLLARTDRDRGRGDLVRGGVTPGHVLRQADLVGAGLEPGPGQDDVAAGRTDGTALGDTGEGVVDVGRALRAVEAGRDGRADGRGAGVAGAREHAGDGAAGRWRGLRLVGHGGGGRDGHSSERQGDAEGETEGCETPGPRGGLTEHLIPPWEPAMVGWSDLR